MPKAAPVRWTCPGHGDRPKITVKGQAIGCFEVGTRYENKHLPCCNTMFQQSEHKEEQKEHKEEQRWEDPARRAVERLLGSLLGRVLAGLWHAKHQQHTRV